MKRTTLLKPLSSPLNLWVYMSRYLGSSSYLRGQVNQTDLPNISSTNKHPQTPHTNTHAHTHTQEQTHTDKHTHPNGEWSRQDIFLPYNFTARSFQSILYTPLSLSLFPPTSPAKKIPAQSGRARNLNSPPTKLQTCGSNAQRRGEKWK